MKTTDLLAAATARFVEEWRDSDSAVRREARERLRGGLWSAPVIQQALANAFWTIDVSRLADDAYPSAEYADRNALTTLVILPGNVVGPALHAALGVARSGARAILKAASSERALADIIARQWTAIGPPLAGRLEARHWSGGDLEAEARALSEVKNVIVFGSDETIDAIRSRLPAGIQFTGHGTRFSVAVVMPDADLAAAAAAASEDICMFDQAGCMSPQTMYVVGDDSRALRFAHALDGAMRQTRLRLPRVTASREEAAASADALRRASITAITASSHGMAPLYAGPANNGAPDFLIIVEPQGPPHNHGFGRIAVVKPLEAGRDPVLTQPVEQIGVAGQVTDERAIALALFGDPTIRIDTRVKLGEMQRLSVIMPAAAEFVQGGSAGA
jgi:hypothetical protein